MEKIIGRITISNQRKIVGRIVRTRQNVQGFISPTTYGQAESYTGDYDITPQAEEQTFSTKGRRMKDDLTIEAIPYFETSNEYGTTVIIGGQ